VPVAFVCWLILFGVLALFINIALNLFLVCLSIYFIIAVIFASFEWIDGGEIYLLVTLPAAFFLWHSAYGLGFLGQAIFRGSDVKA
jgi:hypothetical protein